MRAHALTSPLAQHYENLELLPIAGEWRDGGGAKREIDSDPWSGDTLLEIVQADAADVDAAFTAASLAQRSWRRTLAAERAELMRATAAVLEIRKGEVIGWLVREAGATLAKAELEWGAVRAVFLGGFDASAPRRRSHHPL